MAVNKPTGDNARKGAVRKSSQTKTTLGGASAFTKRDKTSGEFMGVKKPAKGKKAAKKFKGVRLEKKPTKKKKAKKSWAALHVRQDLDVCLILISTKPFRILRVGITRTHPSSGFAAVYSICSASFKKTRISNPSSKRLQ
ncbi:hypothetical protein ABIF65_006624 [Bradyrhizobium japonicum]|uniref:hypothetical protein n=1 Tax=Bradyrhizobium TaxID=374 RepID=UPI001FD93D1E|nr:MULTISPECIES: hypothetical protein [Bradyrhizobium]MCP1744965.1 hypothetical protein [Bradyrhizobium japonicum]MCP1783256.1 hypothetical protein [Bradyrhizobium japonicum]MCP1862596.1 hypothetical protein [Bradyrhizobium japonicum]MCP1893451.1 hypothetical protein [Bradyrhizobium japonicum]MCP1964454.1 hypothetical protein [Bradyrhizobium japonicum]